MILQLLLFQVALATFAIYVLTGNELTANKAFVALSLFNILRYPITMFPNVIISMIQVSYCKLFIDFCRVCYMVYILVSSSSSPGLGAKLLPSHKLARRLT